jgi:hypothetical protein
MITEGQIFFLLLVLIVALLIVGMLGCARRSHDESRRHQRWRGNGTLPPR